MAKATTEPSEAMSVAEMLRIMDVATAIRQDRELVDEQLNLDALKERLRDRMIAAAKVTGEDVTPEEVDAAIAKYYSSLHAFHEPPLSPSLALAHLWVRRESILRWTVLVVGSTMLIWGLFLSPSGPFTITGRAHKRAVALSTEINKRAESIRAVSQDPEIAAQLTRQIEEAATYAKQDDEAKLKTVTKALADLDETLRDEYTISVVSGAGNRSAVVRAKPASMGKDVSGYYLIVQAKRPDGSILKRRIENAETGKAEDVITWAERVPKEVYDRLSHDKLSDGILNETAFAVKRRGFPRLQITMPGSDGRPLTRDVQITNW